MTESEHNPLLLHSGSSITPSSISEAVKHRQGGRRDSFGSYESVPSEKGIKIGVSKAVSGVSTQDSSPAGVMTLGDSDKENGLGLDGKH